MVEKKNKKIVRIKYVCGFKPLRNTLNTVIDYRHIYYDTATM